MAYESLSFFFNIKEGDDSDEDVDDETMMSLDEKLSSLFTEQKKRIQAKKDEKEKLRKEKILRRDFKIKVRIQVFWVYGLLWLRSALISAVGQSCKISCVAYHAPKYK